MRAARCSTSGTPCGRPREMIRYGVNPSGRSTTTTSPWAITSRSNSACTRRRRSASRGSRRAARCPTTRGGRCGRRLSRTAWCSSRPDARSHCSRAACSPSPATRKAGWVLSVLRVVAGRYEGWLVIEAEQDVREPWWTMVLITRAALRRRCVPRRGAPAPAPCFAPEPRGAGPARSAGPSAGAPRDC